MIIPRRHPPGRVAVSLVIGGLGVLYSLYRSYYAFGVIGRFVGWP